MTTKGHFDYRYVISPDYRAEEQAVRERSRLVNEVAGRIRDIHLLSDIELQYILIVLRRADERRA